MVERYGNGQTLAFNGLTLTLNRCNFCVEELKGLGYERQVNNSLKVEYNVYQEAFIKQNPFGYKFDFKWSLYLNESELTLLESIYTGQIRAVSSRSPNFKITLSDNYLPFVEFLPATRIATGRPTDILPPTTAQTAYFARFEIAFTSPPQIEWFFNGLYKVSITASEIGTSLLLNSPIQDGGDMLKSVYDSNSNNIVDNSERLGGELPAYYLDLANSTGELPPEALPGSLKIVLDGPLTLYASPTGSPSNSGLTPASPLSLTAAIERAVDGYIIDRVLTIELADGIYEISRPLAISGFDGNSVLVLSANNATITNSPDFVISEDNGLTLATFFAGSRVLMRNITFETSNLNEPAYSNVIFTILMSASDQANVILENCRFISEMTYGSGTDNFGVHCLVGSLLSIRENIDIAGAYSSVFLLSSSAQLSFFTPDISIATSVNLVSSPTCSYLFYVSNSSVVAFSDVTFTGFLSGRPYFVSLNSFIQNPPSTLPGTLPGVLSNEWGISGNTLVVDNSERLEVVELTSGNLYIAQDSDTGKVFSVNSTSLFTIQLPDNLIGGWNAKFIQAGTEKIQFSSPLSSVRNVNGQTRTAGLWAVVEVIHLGSGGGFVLNGNTGV